MTKAACLLILHCSTLRLCWRSIKAVKSTTGAGPRSIDAEIPQLWALIAFHALYAGIAEVLFSWLPFYFYIKMILLAVTFFPGTKFPAYWFDCLLVPGIDKLHAVLDFDWRQYLVNQAKYLPLLLFDMLFVPGILNEKKGDSAAEGRGVGGANNSSLPLQSPSATRSRIVASSLHLRNFSRDHGGTPGKGASCTRLPDTSPATPLLAGQTPADTTSTKRRRRRRRRTMNETVRKVLCGDENIRVRDYLFDLDMPASPPPGSKGLPPSKGVEVVQVAKRPVISSASRESDERQQEKDVLSRTRRRRTFGGAIGWNGYLDVNSRNIPVRRSERIAEQTRERIGNS